MQDKLKKCIKEIKQNKNLTDDERKYLYALVYSISEFDLSALENISFNGYAECCLCIEKENDNWKLYTAERGSCHYIINYDNLDLLCRDLINKVVFATEQKELIINKFGILIESEKKLIKKNEVVNKK